MSTDAHPLPADPAALQALLLQERAVTQQLLQTIHEQQQKLTQQEQRIAQLLRRCFGPRQERIDPGQLLLFSIPELEALAAEMREQAEQESAEQERVEQSGAGAASNSAPPKRPSHGRRPLPEHLPREQKLYELPLAERDCPACGQTRTEIGRETSEQLECIPAQFQVIEHIRVKYACQSCQEHVALAAKPPQPVEKGLPGPGLLATVVLDKLGDHLPLYREEDRFARQGVIIRRSTLCDWLAAAADLAEPLYLRLCFHILLSRIIHTDDTTVPMLCPGAGQTKTANFWGYLGDAAHPYTVYDFTQRRTRDGPAEFLRDFRGYLQADAYGGYDGVYSGSSGQILEVACWAHCRRYWWEARTTAPARAHHVLGAIARLYQVETACESLTVEQRGEQRQRLALPILHELRTWLDEQAPRLLPKSPVGKAATYMLNQWNALLRYTEDGELAIDNNESERAMKPPALGRKNWLFVGNPKAGRRAAILLSLIGSCKRNQVEPWAYLHDLFATLPTLAENQLELLDAFLPDRWLAAHPNHRWEIDAIRKTERQRRQPLRPRRKN